MGQRNDCLFHSVAADSEVDYLDTIRASFVKWDMEHSLTQQANLAPRPSLSLRTSSVHRWNYCTFLGFFCCVAFDRACFRLVLMTPVKSIEAPHSTV
jgi:hypothetical protein